MRQTSIVTSHEVNDLDQVNGLRWGSSNRCPIEIGIYSSVSGLLAWYPDITGKVTLGKMPNRVRGRTAFVDIMRW